MLRGLGLPYTQRDTGEIDNPVSIKIINRADREQTFTFSAEDAAGLVRLAAEEGGVTLAAGESRTVPAKITAPPSVFATGSHEAFVIVDNGEGFSVRVPYRMQGPVSRAASEAKGATP